MPVKLNKKERKAFERDWNRLRRADSPALSVELATRHLERWPWNGHAARHLADNLRYLGRIAEARALCEKRLKTAKPRHKYMFQVTLARCAEMEGDFDQAVRMFQKALVSARGRFPEILVFLGSAFEKLGEFDRAKRAYRKSIALFDRAKRPEKTDEEYYFLGLIYRSEGKYKKALEYVNRAIALDPNYRVANMARKDLHETIRYLQSEGRSSALRRGLCTSVSSRMPKPSKKELTELRHDWNLLLHIRHSNKPALACERALRHRERWPRNTGALLVLAESLLELMRLDDALPVIKQGLRKSKPQIRLFLEITMGEFLEIKGDLKTAERWYRRAVNGSQRADPVFSACALGYLGCNLAAQRKAGEAKRAHKRAIVLWRKIERPKDADEPYYNLALLYRADGKYKQALEYVNRAIELDPKYAVAKRVRRDLLKTIAYLRTVNRVKTIAR